MRSVTKIAEITRTQTMYVTQYTAVNDISYTLFYCEEGKEMEKIILSV